MNAFLTKHRKLPPDIAVERLLWIFGLALVVCVGVSW